MILVDSTEQIKCGQCGLVVTIPKATSFSICACTNILKEPKK